jgi:23S rRNA (guanosine2251-2'-O)-methyltransferase
VLIKKHLWDFDAVEIARPSSGAYERLPLAQFEDVSLLRRLQRRGLRIYGCIAGAKRTMYDVKLDVPCVVAVGGEKRGLSGAVREICDRFITIPTRVAASGEPVSLSMSHASGILLAEAMRQRRKPAENANENVNETTNHADQPNE